MIFITGKKGTKAKLTISRKAEIPLYKKRKLDAILINYGSPNLDRCINGNNKLVILNRHVSKTKYAVIKEAEAAGILVPESRIQLLRNANLDDWIEKKHHSIGGVGIIKARKHTKINGKYYQRFIKDRLYELRVHAFAWTKNWYVQKRLGSKKEIAWNYSNGGKFQNVQNKIGVFKEAIEIAKKVLKLRNMAFGALDFIVDKNLNIYFIEVNSAPGFTEFSEHIYIEAFKALKQLNKKELLKLAS